MKCLKCNNEMGKYLLLPLLLFFLLAWNFPPHSDNPISIDRAQVWLQEARNSHITRQNYPITPREQEWDKEWIYRYDKILGLLQRIESRYGEEVGQ